MRGLVCDVINHCAWRCDRPTGKS